MQSFFSDSAAIATFRNNESNFLLGGWERSEELNTLIKCSHTWYSVCLSLLIETIRVFDGRIIEPGKTCRQVILKADWVFGNFGKQGCDVLGSYYLVSLVLGTSLNICCRIFKTSIRSCVEAGHIISTRWRVHIVILAFNLRCNELW